MQVKGSIDKYRVYGRTKSSHCSRHGTSSTVARSSLLSIHFLSGETMRLLERTGEELASRLSALFQVDPSQTFLHDEGATAVKFDA